MKCMMQGQLAPKLVIDISNIIFINFMQNIQWVEPLNQARLSASTLLSDIGPYPPI